MKEFEPKRLNALSLTAFAAIVNAAMMRRHGKTRQQAHKSLIWDGYRPKRRAQQLWHGACFAGKKEAEFLAWETQDVVTSNRRWRGNRIAGWERIGAGQSR